MSCSISILGGVGEIGMNMYVYETDKSAVIVDCGVMFADNNFPGIDYVIPGFDYIEKIKHKLRGIFITHGHEDHVGAVPILLRKYNLPVFGGRLSLGILAAKGRARHCPFELNFVDPRQTVRAGDFSITFLPVTHSISDTYALHIETEGFSALHCSDFKIDQTPVGGEPFRPADFTALAEKGLTALLIDSTNAEREGFTHSESSIRDNLLKIFRNAQGRVFFTTFSSNVDRFKQVFDIARECGRKIVLEGAALDRNVNIAADLGYVELPKDLMVDLKTAKKMDPDKICYIITGCQGETNSTLYRVVSGERKDLSVKEGDLFVISARVIPGNEKNLINLVNMIYKAGGSVVDIGKNRIHVSGHASQEEIKLMVNFTRPKFVIPIHGEPVHLITMKRMLKSMSILDNDNVLLIEDGDRLTFENGEIAKKDRVETDKIYIDLRGHFAIDEESVRERKHLSRDGVVTVVVQKNTDGSFELPPVVETAGFTPEEKSIQKLKDFLAEHMPELMNDNDYDSTVIKEGLRRLTKRFFKKTLDRRPLVVPVVLEK
ncbi:ribonuclease J [Seleniivibrio woodruffii]|uniref:Ribonuclease J n=1 Tax=Seleniivibrio woodruffii TaxID=1078050 RepID=A0A4R1KD75_9BACT|nr:ribonuclease J [Seleniivibrio woodruffii]TCK62010.1 ribonuclease J [Seleniivibrio woodruffii]TVZ34873.1 ribonuclease J [Seleniivibrio woodruffii]